MKFEHYLITRVNLGYIEMVKYAGIDPDIWLNNRLKLFYKNCIPSIRNQSNHNFTWLIYLDVRTHQKFVDALINQLDGLENVKLLFKNGDFDGLLTYAAEDVQALISNHTTHIITSRVDSDDMLHRDYILKVQNLFSGQDYQPINFDLGYYYHYSKGVVGITRDRCNNFITLIEKVNKHNSFKTVMHKSHTHYCQDDKKISIKEKPIMWCLSIHDLNIESVFFVRPYIFKNINLSKSFSFQYQIKAKYRDRIIFFMHYCKRVYKRVCKKIIRQMKRF